MISLSPRAALPLVAALSAALSACERPKSLGVDREVDRRLVALDTEHMHLRTDEVGHDQWASTATFVLIDARNTHSQDLMVTLSGALGDGQGQQVGVLRAESLRIPAGQTRTFALIDRDNAARPTATGARVEVAGAYVPNYPPPVVIESRKTLRDSDRPVVTGVVRNTRPRRVKVLVLAAFYDASGVPVRRPFTEMILDGETTSPAQFVGPPGAERGTLFIGDMIY